MNLRYTKLPDKTRPDGFSYYPFLQVFLKNGLNMRPTLALVDSGAVDCIFPASFGEVLGLDIPSGKSHQFKGFNLQPASGFLHKVQLQVTNFGHWIEIEAAFIQSEKVIPILGQLGFFENYQVVFERYKRQFEINTKVDAIIRNKRGHGRGGGR